MREHKKAEARREGANVISMGDRQTNWHRQCYVEMVKEVGGWVGACHERD